MKDTSATSTEYSFSADKAHKTQARLSEKIILENRLPKKIRLVAGVDVAYMQSISIGAVAVLSYNSLDLVESQAAICKTRFPYIPTLLSFREIPPEALCIKKLHVSPDVLLIDGQGYAHPYRCGSASHLGLVVNKPTIGVAKSRLLHESKTAKAEDDFSFLIHDNEVVGAEVATKHGCKPVYVSVGHMVSLSKAIEVVTHCTRHNRIPEPILKAHELANKEKRKINSIGETDN